MIESNISDSVAVRLRAMVVDTQRRRIFGPPPHFSTSRSASPNLSLRLAQANPAAPETNDPFSNEELPPGEVQFDFGPEVELKAFVDYVTRRLGGRIRGIVFRLLALPLHSLVLSGLIFGRTLRFSVER